METRVCRDKEGYWAWDFKMEFRYGPFRTVAHARMAMHRIMGYHDYSYPHGEKSELLWREQHIGEYKKLKNSGVQLPAESTWKCKAA